MEDKKHLGADKEGYLEMFVKIPPTWKKRWFSLRSTSLFYFKEKGVIIKQHLFFKKFFYLILIFS